MTWAGEESDSYRHESGVAGGGGWEKSHRRPAIITVPSHTQDGKGMMKSGQSCGLLDVILNRKK